MLILGNFKNIYETETTTGNNSMGFDLSAIQSCVVLKLSDKVSFMTQELTNFNFSLASLKKLHSSIC